MQLAIIMVVAVVRGLIKVCPVKFSSQLSEWLHAAILTTSCGNLINAVGGATAFNDMHIAYITFPEGIMKINFVCKFYIVFPTFIGYQASFR